jgi:hypothetical protein
MCSIATSTFYVGEAVEASQLHLEYFISKPPTGCMYCKGHGHKFGQLYRIQMILGVKKGACGHRTYRDVPGCEIWPIGSTNKASQIHFSIGLKQ